MSLINKMLRDLDAREQEGGLETNLPVDVRPLPSQRSSRLPFVMGSVLTALLLAGLAYTYWWVPAEEAKPVAVPIAGAVVPPSPVEAVPVFSPPVAETKKEAQAALETEPQTQMPEQTQTPSPLQAQEVAAEKIKPEPVSSLRVSETISPSTNASSVEKTKKAATPAPTTAPVVPKVIQSGEKTIPSENKSEKERGKKTGKEADKEISKESGKDKVESSRPASPVATERVATKSGKSATIERTEVAGSPRERAEVEYRKAISAVNLGRVTEAQEDLHNALRQDSLHIASRQLLVKLLLEARRTDEAIAVLQEGVQGQPAQIGWAMSLARLQVDRSDLAGAWQTLDQSLPAAGNNADYQGFAAHVLQRLGRHKEAAERYQAATRLSPGDGRWWLGLGLVLESEGRSSEAREAFLRARQSGNLSAELNALVEQKLR